MTKIELTSKVIVVTSKEVNDDELADFLLSVEMYLNALRTPDSTSLRFHFDGNTVKRII